MGEGGRLGDSDDCTVQEHPCVYLPCLTTPRTLSVPQVWSTRCERSVAVLDVKANVCSVRFNPWEPHQVAVGSAAHRLMLFDLRHSRQPLASLAGHRRAVSYVRWV